MTSETPLAVAAAQRLLQRKGGVLEPLKSPYEWLGIDEKGRLFRAFLGKLYGISKKRGYIIGIYIIGIYIYMIGIYIYNRYIYICHGICKWPFGGYEKMLGFDDLMQTW